jgi:hypothetical protein
MDPGFGLPLSPRALQVALSIDDTSAAIPCGKIPLSMYLKKKARKGS